MKFFRTLITVGRFGIKLADKGGFMKKRIIIFSICALVSLAVFVVAFSLFRSVRNFHSGTIVAAQKLPSKGSPNDYNAEQNLRYAAYKLNSSNWMSTYSTQTDGIISCTESGSRYKKNRSVLWLRNTDELFPAENGLFVEGETAIIRIKNDYYRISKEDYFNKYGFIPYELSSFVINSDTKKSFIQESYDKSTGVYTFVYTLKPDSAVHADKILKYEIGLVNVTRSYISVVVKMNENWDVLSTTTTERYSTKIVGDLTFNKVTTEKFEYGLKDIPHESEYKKATDFGKFPIGNANALISALSDAGDMAFSIPYNDDEITVNLLSSTKEVRIRYGKNEVRSTATDTYIYSKNAVKIALPLATTALMNGNEKLKLLGEICMVITAPDVKDIIKSLASVISVNSYAVSNNLNKTIASPNFSLTPDYEVVRKILRSIVPVDGGIKASFLLDDENYNLTISLKEGKISAATINGATINGGDKLTKDSAGTDVTRLLADTVMSAVKCQYFTVTFDDFYYKTAVINGKAKVSLNGQNACADLDFTIDNNTHNFKIIYDDECSLTYNDTQSFYLSKTNFSDTVSTIYDAIRTNHDGLLLRNTLPANRTNSFTPYNELPISDLTVSNILSLLSDCEISATASDDNQVIDFYYGEKIFSLGYSDGVPTISGKGFKADFVTDFSFDIAPTKRFDINGASEFAKAAANTVNKGNCYYKGSLVLSVKTELINLNVSDIDFEIKADYRSGNVYTKISVPSSALTTKANSFIFVIGDTVYLKSDRYSLSVGAVNFYKETLYKTMSASEFYDNVTENLLFLIPLRENVANIVAASLPPIEKPANIDYTQLLVNLYNEDDSFVAMLNIAPITGIEQSSLALEFIEKDGYFNQVNAGVKISVIELSLSATALPFSSSISLGSDTKVRKTTLEEMAQQVPSAFKSYSLG